MAENDLPDETNVADAFIIYTAEQEVAVSIGSTTYVDFD